MAHQPPHRRKTGYYWVKLRPIISDGWEIGHYSAAFRDWQLHGKQNSFEEGLHIIKVDENQIENKYEAI
jgi:hypothetical protein